MQIVVIIADDGHAVGRDTDRLTEAEDHAGLRLGAVTAVISRNEIDIVFETEADGRLADGVFVVAGGDTELVAASLQPREKPLRSVTGTDLSAASVKSRSRRCVSSTTSQGEPAATRPAAISAVLPAARRLSGTT